MKPIIINVKESKISYLSENQLLRVDFLLGTIVVNASNMGEFLIQYEQAFYEDKPIDFKAKMIQNHIGFLMGEDKDIMTRTLKVYYSLTRQKHKSGTDIILLKKLDKEITVLYRKVGEIMQRTNEQFGFLQLKPLADKGRIGTIRTDAEIHEGHKPGSDNKNLSDIIKYSMNLWEPEWSDEKKETVRKNFGETLLTLSTEFFNFNDWNAPEPTSINDKSSTSNFTMDLLLEVPSLITLSAAELELIKEEIDETLEPFDKTLDSWITLTNLQDPEANIYFINNVLPLKDNLQNALKTNQTLAHLTNILLVKTPVKIYFGTIPLYLLLQYYTYQKIITQLTIDVMETYMNENAMCNNLVAFMAIDFNGIEQFEKANKETATVIPSKKSIAID